MGPRTRGSRPTARTIAGRAGLSTLFRAEPAAWAADSSRGARTPGRAKRGRARRAQARRARAQWGRVRRGRMTPPATRGLLAAARGFALGSRRPRHRFCAPCRPVGAGARLSAEGCRSGRTGRSRKPLYARAYRGFESHPLRQQVLDIAQFSIGIRTLGTVRGSPRAFATSAGASGTERARTLGLVRLYAHIFSCGHFRSPVQRSIADAKTLHCQPSLSLS